MATNQTRLKQGAFCLLFIVIFFIFLLMFGSSNYFLDIDPIPNNYPFPESFSGPFALNNVLSGAKKLFEGQLDGPESVAVFEDLVITSTRDGYIYRIHWQNETLVPLLKMVDKSCQTWNQSLCSQPLGMKFDSKGDLYVVDSNFGIFRIKNVSQSKPIVEHILGYEETEKLGERSKFFDDLAIDEGSGLNGGNVLYVTELSYQFDITQIIFALTSSQAGRILRYDIDAKKLDVILSELHCPNGIEMSEDKEFFIFSQTVSRTISKHYVKGPKAGQTTTLVSALPGEPDNVRRTQHNTYWVGVATARTQQDPLFFDYFANTPSLRKLFFRFLHLSGNIIHFVGRLLNIESVKNFGHHLETGLNYLIVGQLSDSHGMVFEMDELGNITQCLHSPDGTVTLLSEAKLAQQGNQSVLYLGSFYNNYLGLLILNKTNIDT